MKSQRRYSIIRLHISNQLPFSLQVGMWHNRCTHRCRPIVVALFLKWPAATWLNFCITLTNKLLMRHKQGTLSSYFKALNYSLGTYVSDDVIAETDADMICSTQLSNKLPTQYAKALWNKALRCNRVYEEYVPKGIFILRDCRNSSATVSTLTEVRRRTQQSTIWSVIQQRWRSCKLVHKTLMCHVIAKRWKTHEEAMDAAAATQMT